MSLVDARALAIPGRIAEADLRVEAATLTCLVGPNGSGKTSLLHALARIGGAAGRVVIGGVDVESIPPSARFRLLAYLPASRDLGWPLAARDLIALGGADDEEVETAIARLELNSVAERRADRLSTGERSRVLIARAMAPKPSLLLLDEPIANLDPLWQIKLMELLRAEIHGSGRAAIVAMHDLDAAGRYADRLIVMRDGRIAADGPPADILASTVIPAIFGVERDGAVWRAVSRPGDRRSSP